MQNIASYPNVGFLSISNQDEFIGKSSKTTDNADWKSVESQTYLVLVIVLITLITSFCITSYGSYLGEQLINNGPLTNRH